MSMIFMPQDMDWVCEPCGERMESGKVELTYLGNAFHVELPVCPRCGAVYIYEELA
ncbi:MAG: DNA-binding protein, partial [Desulfovibrionales bacterium]|nr:DNA-binding protein [Desulfovibrionales bacterium]